MSEDPPAEKSEASNFRTSRVCSQWSGSELSVRVMRMRAVGEPGLGWLGLGLA